MKIFFSMRHPGALRNFSSTLRELLRRGHQIHLSFIMQDKLGDGRLLWELTDDHPGITYSEVGKKTPWRFWLGPARAGRYWVDYLRYLDAEYAGADKLRDRAALRVPTSVVLISKLPLINTKTGRRLLSKLLLLIERAIPADAWVTGLIAAQAPDVVLVTPLVDLGSDQTDVVKSAKALGVPTGLCVHSWDNLTNKGLMRVVPDRVFVWNEAQKAEAAAMHGCRPDQVVVTGAPVFDQWFARQPSTSREAFCGKTGLRADTPYFLYLCSSAFISPNESDFIAAWLRALQSATDPRVRNAAVLIRPHPENLQPWQRFDTEEFPNVVIWPRGGANPVDAGSKNDFYDSIYHSVAAVGINTTAQIESGIVGKPVFSIRSDEHQGTQEGTLHFHYLLNLGGGLVFYAQHFDEHTQQLSRALDGRPEDAAKLRNFVTAFVRPHGLQTEATPLLADGIEALAGLGSRGPQRTPLWLYPLRWAMYPVALAMKVVRQFTRTRRKRERQLRPLTVAGMLIQPLFKLLDLVLRWRPIKSFVKKYVVPRVIPRMMEAGNETEEMIAIPRIIDKLHHGTRPIIVGPWMSEVGFEILYWIPFLNWVKTYRQFDLDRLVVVSRGGVSSWYQDIGVRYVDLFDFFTPEQFKQKNEQRITEGKQKQRMMVEFDREILKLVKLSIDARDAEVLHPMYMYRLFYPYWKSQASMNLIENFASYRRLRAPDTSDIRAQLPAEYVAVRFYFNDSFPEVESNRVFVQNLLKRLTDTTDVVLLNPGLDLDDHWDLTPEAMSRVHTAAHLMQPRTNLDIQTKIIAGAKAFVGNYGGLSYVAPSFGVPSLAFYSNPEGFSVYHLELAHRVFAKMKRGSFVVLDVEAVELVNMALHGVLSTPNQS